MKPILRRNTCFALAFLAACGTLGMRVNAASADVSEARYYDTYGVSPCADAGSVEKIEFSRREETVYIYTPNNVPYYYNVSLTNACGAIGGGIVVGYYDKYFENLIPDYTPYYAASGKYKSMETTEVSSMIGELYTYMRTNVDDVGVSRTDCLNGLQAYVQDQGYSLSYTSVMGTSFDHSAYQTAINNGEPVLLFCSSVELCDIYPSDTYDEIGVAQNSTNHIMVGFGYRQIKYYDENDTNFRTDTYLKVASGWAENSMGYVKINSDAWLNNAYAVDIY